MLILCELNRVSWTHCRRRRTATQSTTGASPHGFPPPQDSQGTSVIPRTRKLLSEVYPKFLAYSSAPDGWHTKWHTKQFEANRMDEVNAGRIRRIEESLDISTLSGFARPRWRIRGHNRCI